MIPRKIFTSFAKFQGIVSVNDFKLPIWSKNFCKLLCVSWEVFCFARICLDPLGGQVLHHDCSFEISFFYWELCDLLLSSHQKFLHEVRLRHCVFCTGPCNFGPLTDLPISVFREVSINTMFTPIRTSRRRRLWRWFMRRTCVWVSAFRNSIIHEIFSEFLQLFRFFRNTTGTCSCPHSWFVFLDFGWFCATTHISEEYGSPRTCLSTFFSLDTIAGGWRRIINFLPWTCHGCWRGQKVGGRTRWQARNHDRNEVLRVAL